ncbi:MAG: SNF2-related protein [Planctomycetota bacterium]|nr:SNF2-related protein [Planctomycetota bacterium]
MTNSQPLPLPTTTTMLQPNTAIETYDGRAGVIRGFLKTIAGVDFYQVAFGGSIQRLPATDFFVPDGAEPWREICGPDAVRRIVTELKVESRTRDMLASLSATTTNFYAYQYKPLIKLMRSHHGRILVGDEVGLGKTIEAGFTLLEILARQPDASVLIVCPPMLREKWRRELLDRFGLAFRVLRSVEADQKVAQGVRGEAEGPLRAIVSYETVRREQFREKLDASQANEFDLLVVDEAHRARKRTAAQSRAVEELTQRCQKAIFLTATPIQTHANDLGRLLEILLPQEFPSDQVFELRQQLNESVVDAERAVNAGDPRALEEAIAELRGLESVSRASLLTSNPSFKPTLEMLERLHGELAAGALSLEQSAKRRIEAQSALFEINLLSPFFTRTRRVDIEEDMPIRRAYPATMELTEYEYEIYHALSEAIFAEYERRHSNTTARLVIVGYQQRLASSIAASVRHLRELLEAEERTNGPVPDDDPNMAEISDDDDGDDAPQSAPGASASAASAAQYSIVQCPAIARILRSADITRLEREDTKWKQLSQVLRDHMSKPGPDGSPRKMILFSYYKRSLDLIARHLHGLGIQHERIDGDVPTCPEDPENDERQKRITRFRESPEINLLISSQVGTEGLDFQFCDTIVNWDLPWNPMTVEQRIGRIDRIGQKAEVLHIVNIVCKRTVEWRILDRLYNRIEIFERSIGDISEILGSMEHDLRGALLKTDLSDEEIARRIEANTVALENRVNVARTVERESEKLIGQDRFLVDEVTRLKRAGKYLTPLELQHFVTEQVKRLDHDSKITTDASGRITLNAGGILLSIIDDALKRHRSPDWLRFAARLRRGPLRLSFESSDGKPTTDVELVGAAHPLVRTLAMHLEASASGSRQFMAHAASDVVPEGTWALSVSVMKETAGSDADASILCAAVRVDGGPMGDEDFSDDLLHAVIATGQPWLDGGLGIERRIEFGAQAEMAMLQLFARRRTDRLAEAERDAARKLAVIEADFEWRAQRVREKIARVEDSAVRGSKSEAILPAFRGQLQSLETKRDQQLAAIERLARPSISETTILVGIVKVERPQGVQERTTAA